MSDVAAEPAAGIRRARASDAPVLAALSGELGYQVTELEIVERLASLPMTDEVFVAEAGDMIVGWIHLTVQRTLVDEPAVDVYGLVVSERWRGRGIGHQLIACANEYAAHRGLGLVRLRSNVIRERAHEFYVGLGFEEVKRQVTFARRVGGAVEPLHATAVTAPAATGGSRSPGD